MNQKERFDNLSNFYENLKTVMAAICVQKGGIPVEGYVGRFFAADVLEMLDAYGRAAGGNMAARYAGEFAAAKDLVTPSQKPMHEMTLEEFEKVMNI